MREGLGDHFRWVQGRQRDMGPLGGRAGSTVARRTCAQTRLGEQKRAEGHTGRELTVGTAMSVWDALGSDVWAARTTLDRWKLQGNPSRPTLSALFHESASRQCSE